MQDALAGGAIAKEAKHHIVRALVLLGKSQACAGAYLGAYDAVTAKKALFLGKEVHAASLAFGTTRSLAKQLGHTGIGGYTFGNGQSVIAVSCNEFILG